MRKDAVIVGLYRYSLWREWDTNAPRVAFVMLNPSRADATNDDPTLRRCINFAQSWGYGSLEVVNLFAYRASKPAELKKVTDPVGSENDHYLEKAIKSADKIIVAWGNHGILRHRYKVVLNMLAGLDGLQLYCLGTTKKGHPRHPLYLKSDTKPVTY
ncbi:DUF1643 domain-containing protein [Limnofasciculus baicalensis]|uniref:DUF1643 domain-containing protein n=1 Tax=Limnofasciculus baicalensis BBK-W-15 TaxID=2699891 RepID=A0AAE3GPV4_9CYAN|nr:DUF1643 domain-containing protein [Limnofasciculus baicalensis]MCP2728314.1 DUF1643 domain-containing protein [Limnofasciculus baicalensis BBK-W-15]